MDSLDRPAGPPQLPPSPAPSPPAVAWEEPVDWDGPAPRILTLKVALRALRRHWWRILGLWAVGSSALMAVAYAKVRPVYEVAAILQVEPGDRAPIGQAGGGGGPDLEALMATQVQLIQSDDVLGLAASDPDVATLPRLRTAPAASPALRRALTVAIPPGTHLITVGVRSTDPGEGPLIVNAVLDAYLKALSGWIDEQSRQQLAQLRDLEERFRTDVARQRQELEILVRKYGSAKPLQEAAASQALAEYQQYKGQLTRVKLEKIEVEASLKVLRDASARRPAGVGAGGPPIAADRLEERARVAFRDDPRIIALHAQILRARRELAARKRIIKSPSDPALVHARGRVEDLEAEGDRLWRELRPGLLRQLARPGAGDPIADRIDELTKQMAKLSLEEAELDRRLARIVPEKETEGNEVLKADFLRRDLARSEEMLTQVQVNLERLEFESGGRSKVAVIGRPDRHRPAPLNSDHRLKVMAAAPLAALALVAGLFVLAEARAGRVADPDDLPARLRLGVLGVVPPLPSLRAPTGPRALRDQRRRLEEFVQGLDHLRVALCASAGPGGRRCVLITSACGGEGKTTLAAQLAGRCANAGLTTLLVDADLRRPALGELLEVPRGAGLAEILRGEADLESALAPIASAGFHLLPAGLAGSDPSRLLQGDRLGQLVARLREAFDIVILDAPPILPVPDSLLIGRWTDGAVLALRHDVSRFPLVERARKRLDSVGVPILGAVVNGVRPAETSYGAYTSYYADASAGDGSPS